MSHERPYKTAGVTLLCVEDGGEFRRVFARRAGERLEVGEYTEGDLTQEIYDAPACYQCVRLRSPAEVASARLLSSKRVACQQVESIDVLRDYFFTDGRYLVDLMDELDAAAIPYSFMNSPVGANVHYRPEGFRYPL